jgi:hypothetical protein
MPVFTPINARSYYDYLPPSAHACGDIWVELPSMGLLSSHNRLTGIMVTPACDVSNFKAETLTYLPVVPIRVYLASVALLPIIRREVVDRYRSAKIELAIDWPEKGYEPPTEEALNSELQRLGANLKLPKLSAGDKGHIERAAAGLRIAAVCRKSARTHADIEDYALLFGKQWEGIKRDIVRNSYRPDIHFLPAAEGISEGLGIVDHSVALFRYPLSVPSEILTAAQTVSASAWTQYVDSCSDTYSASVHFSGTMPTKVLSLKAAFLSDLLSRFTALFGRIGSPDFSSIVVDKYVGEIA